MMMWKTGLDTFAFSAFGIVITGRHFDGLPAIEKRAIVAHEEGHIRNWHQAKRIWWLVSLQWHNLTDRCKQQELQADKYAVILGHSEGLMAFLKRIGPHENPLHPTPEVRIKEIEKWKTTAHSDLADPSR